MYSFVSEEIGTLIVNSVLLFLAFVVFLLVTLAILTAVRDVPAGPEETRRTSGDSETTHPVRPGE